MRQGFTLWFTGLPSSGKSTLAEGVEGSLLERGLDVELLDEEMLRRDFGEELGSDRAGLERLARRAGIIANLLTRNGTPAIVAMNAPFREAREKNRELIGRFIEVYCRRPLDDRPPRRADEASPVAELPFEEPVKAEIVVEAERESVEETCRKILRTLELLNYIPGGEGDAEYSPREEEEIKKRLKDLGYI